MGSSWPAACCLLCLVLAAACEAGPASHRQLRQSGFFEPGSGAGGSTGRGRRRGGGGAAAAATCESSAQSLLPEAQREIQQAVSKAFQQCTLVPCRPEAAGVAPVGGLCCRGSECLVTFWPAFHQAHRRLPSQLKPRALCFLLQVIAEAVAPALVAASSDALSYCESLWAPLDAPAPARTLGERVLRYASLVLGQDPRLPAFPGPLPTCSRLL